jgi:hypothetical protein
MHAAEEGGLFVPADARGLDPRIEILLEYLMAGRLVTLTAFLVQAQPPALAVLEEIADLHRYRRAHAGKAIDHNPDQRPVAKPN